MGAAVGAEAGATVEAVAEILISQWGRALWGQVRQAGSCQLPFACGTKND